MTPNQLTPDIVHAAVGKAQYVRVLDVIAIGPLMVWGGVALAPRSKLAGWALGLCGVATVLYNARNFVVYEQKVRPLLNSLQP